MPYALLIGLGAGLVSAVLFASASTGTILGLFVLFLLSPLPLAIAGLGWGWATAAVAAGAGTALVMIAGTPRAAVFYVLALGLPTAVLVYLTLLHRETLAAAPSGQTSPGIVWYPLGRIVTAASLWGGGLGALALLTTARDVEALRAVLRGIFERVVVQAMPLPPVGQGGLGESEITAVTELIVVSFAGAVATVWTAIALLNLWLAAVVTRKSGRLGRPWQDLSTLTLPRSLPLAFAFAILLTFVAPAYISLMASGFASAFMFAFMLAGLAIIHNVSRGHGLRPAILGGVYVALVIFNPLSSFIIGLVGLAEPFSPLRRRPPPSSPPPAT
jgi:hypothetical protein